MVIISGVLIRISAPIQDIILPVMELSEMLMAIIGLQDE
jgi:hypothetical protein